MMTRRATARMGIGVLLLTAVVTFVYFFFTSYAVPIERYNQVVEGMTETQVRTIMGSPDHIRHDRPDTTAFYYGGWGRLRWCNMEVYFDRDRHVTGKFHDD
jgi:outer membrane protein assembly factor BamE (lipoprotein component of BamABCDE complex)